MEQSVGKRRGLLDAEFARLTPLDLISAEEVDAVAKAIQTVLSRGEDAIESQLLTKDRNRIPYYFKGTRLITEQ